MYTSTIIAGLVAAASVTSAAAIERSSATYRAPEGKGDFALQVIATAGDLSYSGSFLTTVHSGAGLNALSAVPAQSSATTFKFDPSSGFISQKLGDYPYSLVLSTETNTVEPKGYYSASFNVGGTVNRFHFSGADNLLQFGPTYKDDIWAVCPGVVEGATHVPLLFLRSPKTKADPKCADVKVKAIF